MMADNILRYDKMVEDALRGVVRQTLMQVMEHGLPAEHHFYVTFDTTHRLVEIPVYLKERYPSEMTIVMQHQFYGLKITDELFTVTLSFNNNPERLVVPFEAIRIFADPSVSFALQFESAYEEDDNDSGDDDDDFDEEALDALIAETERALAERGKRSELSKEKGSAKKEKKPVAGADDKRGEVVSLADFRKKTDKDK